jgi:hypothetical protein
MTRDELEAVIWRNWPERGPSAGAAVDQILAAADEFATATAAVALKVGPQRRLPAVHYQAADSRPACGYGHGHADPATTATTTAVTCRACQRTSPYRIAAGLAQAGAAR